MTANKDVTQGNQLGAPTPFVVRYSRKSLIFLLAFGCAIMAFGQYLLTAENGGITYRMAGIAFVPTGISLMAHAVRYFVSTRLVTILPTGLVYHGMVKNFRADWSEISRIGAGQGDEAADPITFYATGPFGVFGKFAINEMLIGGPNGDLATIAAALDRARHGEPSAPQFGKRRPLSL
jgi:hypothetical protein